LTGLILLALCSIIMDEISPHLPSMDHGEVLGGFYARCFPWGGGGGGVYSSTMEKYNCSQRDIHPRFHSRNVRKFLEGFPVLGCYILCSESLVEVDQLTVEVKVDRQQVKDQGRSIASQRSRLFDRVKLKLKVEVV
jgi:hypothetical protein